MRRVAVFLLTMVAFAVPWEYSLDLGEPFGNIARVISLLAAAAVLANVAKQRRVRRAGALVWLVLALYLYFLCGFLWTVNAETTLNKMRAYLQVFFLLWLVWEAVETGEDLRGLLCGFVGGCWVLAILTFLNFSSPEAAAMSQIRFVAEGQDPNDVARFLDLGMPLAALLVVTEQQWTWRWLGALYLPAGLAAVLLTASRGGFSGSLVALAGSTLLVLAWRPKAVTGLLAGVAGAAAALWLVVPADTLARLGTIPGQVASADLNDRLSLWIAGWHAFVQAPWFGYGAGTYSEASGLAAADTAHNTLMALLVTSGTMGTSLFVAILMLVAWAVVETTGLVRLALGTVFVVWMITAAVGSVEENRATWLLFGMIAVAGRLAAEGDPALQKMAVGYIEMKPGGTTYWLGRLLTSRRNRARMRTATAE